MPMTRNYTTLLLYIMLSILLLVLPLSNVAFAQSTTPGGPGPLEGFIEEIKETIEEIQKRITAAFVVSCESVTGDNSPGVKHVCEIVLQDRIER